MSLIAHTPFLIRRVSQSALQADKTRVPHRFHEFAKRARPVALTIGLFGLAFTVTVVLRLILALAYLAMHFNSIKF